MAPSPTDLQATLARAAESAVPSTLPLFGWGQSGELPLDLPDGPGAAQTELGVEAMHVMSALYLAAQLEQTGLVAVAEVLVRDRAELAYASIRAASLMEEFAAKLPDQPLHARTAGWYTRDQRDALYARLFGIGRLATDAAATPNADFARLLAALCNAVVTASEPNARTPDRVVVHDDADALRENLAPRQYGSTLFAAGPIHDQLVAATQLLSDPSVRAMFSAQSMWSVIAHVLGVDAPDAGHLVDSGQAGQQVLSWLAGPMVGALPAVAAARWLAAAGFAPSVGRP